MLKAYLKPEISKVEMRPIEAALLGCKSTSGAGGNLESVGYPVVCVPGGTACKTISAS